MEEPEASDKEEEPSVGRAGNRQGEGGVDEEARIKEERDTGWGGERFG